VAAPIYYTLSYKTVDTVDTIICRIRDRLGSRVNPSKVGFHVSRVTVGLPTKCWPSPMRIYSGLQVSNRGPRAWYPHRVYPCGLVWSALVL